MSVYPHPYNQLPLLQGGFGDEYAVHKIDLSPNFEAAVLSRAVRAHPVNAAGGAAVLIR